MVLLLEAAPMYHRRLGQDNSLVLSMCFDARDLSSEAQDVVIERAAELFADLDVVVEVCNEARVHLWYEEHFGVPAGRITCAAGMLLADVIDAVLPREVEPAV